MIEKKRKMIQTIDIFGENLSAGNLALEERKKKILENLRRRHEELRRWLIAHGHKVRDNEEVK